MAQVELQEFKTLDGKPVLTEAARRDGNGKLITTNYLHTIIDPGYKQYVRGETEFSGVVTVRYGDQTVNHGRFYVKDIAPNEWTEITPDAAIIYYPGDAGITGIDTTRYEKGKVVLSNETLNTSYTLNFPLSDGTLALVSDIPTNHVTTDTTQTITG